jgi:sodium/potassium-transporting ATPase subunit alpha
MRIDQLTAEQALASLGTTADGLSAAEAVRRLGEFGPNQVQRVARTPLLVRLLREFTHFFAVILWIAAGLAAYAAARDPGQGMGTLAVAIVGVILVNGVFSFWQEYRAERALAALEKLLPHRINVFRDGQVELRQANELVPGDLVALEAGSLVPADCRLIESFGLVVNNATVTGESVPVQRNALPSTDHSLLQSTNVVLAGTSIVAGEARAVVYATGRHTEFGRIAHLTQSAREVSFPLQDEIRLLSRLVALLALALGAVFFLIGLAIPLSLWQNLLFAIGIIVANVPEGLLPTVTLSLAMGAQRMARRNVLIRHLPAVETLGAATVICTDKTGTLTQNRMSPQRAFLGGRWLDAADAGRSQPREMLYERFAQCLLLCHSLTASSTSPSGWEGDPTEVGLAQLGRRMLGEAPDWPLADEIPFDSDRKRMSKLFRAPEGPLLLVKGALESLLPLASSIHTEEGVVPADAAANRRYAEAQDEMARSGLRVLAIGYRQVKQDCPREQLEQELVLAGLVGLADPPRPEVPAALARCHAAGIRVIMVTGDHPVTALGIGRQIGLICTEHPRVIVGDHLTRMSDNQLQLALDAPEILFARASADHKLRIAKALQRKGHIVAMTGDGVNDAPALRQANIGIAMGVSGTDVTRETADMVLADDNFASIVAAIEEGRAVFENIRKFLTYILTSNIPEVVPYLAFVLFRIPLPLTIIQILAVDLGTDLVPALALGAEPPDPEIMQRPPRRRKERLVTWPLVARAYLWLGLWEAAAAMLAFSCVLTAAGWTYGQRITRGDTLWPVYIQATTACLAAIVVAQIVNLFLCRSDRQSAWRIPLRANPLLLVGIGVELVTILVIVYTPLGNALFGTSPLPLWAWLIGVPVALAMFAAEEGRKWLVRGRSGNSQGAASPTHEPSASSVARGAIGASGQP